MTTSSVSSAPLSDRADQAVAGLAPGYFAFVMGTGIVAVGLRMVGQSWPARVLLGIAVIGAVVLAVLYVLRWVRHRERMMADVKNPSAAFGYFTIVAAASVLAVNLQDEGLGGVALGLLGFGAAVWIVLGYVLPWQVLMLRDGEPILARTNGSWFIWSVASQSLAVGLSGVVVSSPGLANVLGVLTVMAWAVGTVLYIGIGLLVLLRVVHHGITPQQFDPTYWVSMGAVAIMVVAGAGIYGMHSVPMVDAARSLIGGTVVVVWCFAIWLLPLLAGAGFWRHVLNRVPLRYMPGLWSIVFPLGMISVASLRLGRVEELPIVETVGYVMMVIAVTVWALVFLGLLRTLLRGLRGPRG